MSLRRHRGRPRSPLRRSLAILSNSPPEQVASWFTRIMKISSGRDKVCAFCQNAAMLGASMSVPETETWAVCLGIEDNLSQGRKIFRFLKFISEATKFKKDLENVDENWSRYQAMTRGKSTGLMDGAEGADGADGANGADGARVNVAPASINVCPNPCASAISGCNGSGGNTVGSSSETGAAADYRFAALCHLLDAVAHFMAFNYFWLDNLVWAISMGLWRSKQVPAHLKGVWHGGRRNEGIVVSLGGMRGIKTKRNFFSLFRNLAALLSHALFVVHDWGWLTGRDIEALSPRAAGPTCAENEGEAPVTPMVFKAVGRVAGASETKDSMDTQSHPIASSVSAPALDKLGALQQPVDPAAAAATQARAGLDAYSYSPAQVPLTADRADGEYDPHELYDAKAFRRRRHRWRERMLELVRVILTTRSLLHKLNMDGWSLTLRKQALCGMAAAAVSILVKSMPKQR